MLLGLALLLQGGAWTATPARPTVGDTVWLALLVTVPAGWHVRADRLEGATSVEPLGDPVVERAAGGWRVRYPVVAWTPGIQSVTLPAVWLVGPAGRTDSLPKAVARIDIASVLPDTGRAAPRPALAPLRAGQRRPGPPALAAALALAALAAGWRWRRRAARRIPDEPPPRIDAPVPDRRWLEAGEPRAVAARARAALRAAIARAVPGAHPALSTVECLAAVERAKLSVSAAALGEALRALDEAEFASVPAADVPALAARARALTGALGG